MSAATSAAAGPGREAGPGVVRLTALHTWYQVLETVRIPVAVIGTAAFPTLSFLFFVAPQEFAQIPEAATAAAAQLSLFAVMSVCLFSFGVGVAEDRALPWDGYLRTLPAGPASRLSARLLAGLVLAFVGLVPLAACAWLLTAATLPVGRVPLTALALAAAGVPLLGIGLTIGYAMPTKAALAVAQVLLLPLAFGGGLFLPPETFPAWLDTVSQWLPTRAGRELVVPAAVGGDVAATSVAVLLGWSVAAMALAVWAYRRDEGRRFR